MRQSVKNPYWHKYEKPHVVDYDEVRELCFQGYSILEASRSLMGRPGEEIGGTLHDAFFRMAEPRLSSAFLRIALTIRTFEDIIADTVLADEYATLLKKIIEPEQLGTVGKEGSEVRSDITLREVCNKIIHAEDFRPIYDNASHSRDEEFAWGMTGTIEIAGHHRGKRWDLWLNSSEFLTACLEVVNTFDPVPDDLPDEATTNRNFILDNRINP